MNSYLVYRASFYLMMTVATLALSGDMAEVGFARTFPYIAILAAVLAYFTVDRNANWSIPRQFADLIGLSTIGVLYYESQLEDTQMVRALGHWLFYLQMIKYFLPKKPEDDWFLFMLGLMQILIAAVVSQSDQIGAWLFLWAMLAIWVLGQFFLQREAHRLMPRELGSSDVLGAWADDPYRGVFDLPSMFSTLRVMVTTLALGGLIFLVLPRQAGATRNQAGAQAQSHLTGFDEEVQLGQFGEILENDTVVMTVETTDEEGNVFRQAGEPLWRGVTMTTYDRGTWKRKKQGQPQTIVGFPSRRAGGSRPVIHQKIKLESNDSSTLFALRPIRNAFSRRRVPPYLSTLDGTIYRSDRAGTGPYDYEVDSDPDADAPQAGEEQPSAARQQTLMAMPADLKERLKKIAEPIIASLGPEASTDKAAKARAIEQYLRDSGKFAYSLKMDVIDLSLDPVEDFLINRKEGHCEYYASALALLLRSVDVPCRVVNGFKGGDWNDLTQTYIVRQKHAHSWVEAYLGPGPLPDRFPVWMTLDPTPANERQESIAQVGGITRKIRPLTDVIRHIWVFYIIGYDGDRQNRLLYTPMREMLQWAREKYATLGLILRGWFAFVFHFQSPGSLISVRGFIVTFMSLVTLSFLILVFARLGRWLLGLVRGAAVDDTSLTARIVFYRRLVQLLSQYDLERTAAETQGEFAVRAGKFLQGKGPSAQDVVQVPRQVVDAFYRVRFGHLELETDSLEELDRGLDALEASLKPSEP
jgi:transglutaminase-like putative cysteine protease